MPLSKVTNSYLGIKMELFMAEQKRDTIVLGVVGADCHAVGNKILERVFDEQGFKVVNLGVMVSQDEFIDAAIETNAKAILVSSLYGQGELDCEGLRERCVERGIEDVILYVGVSRNGALEFLDGGSLGVEGHVKGERCFFQ